MTGRRAVPFLLGMALAAPCAAQFSIGAGIEHFTWSEQVSPSVDERGPMQSLWIRYVQPKSEGWLLGYEGKLYTGDVTYTGSTLPLSGPSVPVTSTTSYSGMRHEFDVRRRWTPRNRYPMAILAGIGVDQWQRQLSASQREDYRIGYVRLGLEADTIEDQGWTAAGGVKYPFYTHEDAHLTAIGFSSNPTLSPGKQLSIYLQAGYRLNRDLQIIGYTDGYRFSESKQVGVSYGGTPMAVYQPASTLRVYGIRLEYTFR